MSKVKENLERIQALQDRYKSEAKFEAESWFERGAVPNAEFHHAGIRYRAKIDALQWVLDLDWGEDSEDPRVMSCDHKFADSEASCEKCGITYYALRNARGFKATVGCWGEE